MNAPVDDDTEIGRIAVSAIQNFPEHNRERDGSLPYHDPVEAGEWLIGELRYEAERVGYPLHAWEDWALRNSTAVFTEEMIPAYVNLNNRAVPMIRHRIELYKSAKVPTMMVRWGLTVPVIWEAHYAPVYTSELPWTISAVMQNVFLGNPIAGEKRPWKSR